MRKFLQKFGKQILAVVSVLLMIAWVFTPSGNQRPGMAGDNSVIGRFGPSSEKLYTMDAVRAKNALELLARQRVDFMGRSIADAMFGPVAAKEMTDRPELFALLVKEAEQMGVTASKDQVNEIVQNILPPDVQQDPDRVENFKYALEQALVVQGGFRRAANVIKISQPLRQHELATQGQGLSVNLVEFDANKFAAKVQPPTTQQIQEQYTKYRDNVRGNTSTTNPAGFGYRYPDRLKLQYIAVPRMEVRRAVESSREPRRWDVDAYKYYQQNQIQFPTTQQSAPATQQAFSLDTPRKQATTRPFDEVKLEIKNQLISAETDKVQRQIVERIQSILGADYMAYRSALGTSGATQPTTAPASSLKVPYGRFDYLQALADQVQKQYKVRPTVVSMHDKFITPEETLKIPGLGEVRIGQENVSTYLGSLVAAFQPEGSKTEGVNLLQLNQPSMTLQDGVGNVYLLRVTEAQRSHPPAALVEVVDQVRQDVLMASAFDIAKKDAEKLLKESNVGGLKSAAQAAGLQVITTGTFLNQPEGQIPGYVLFGPAKGEFLKQAYKLLSTPPAHPGAQPIRLIELPLIAKVDVAELASVTPLWSPDTNHLVAERAAGMAAQEQSQQFQRDWFDFDSVVARMQYKPTEEVAQSEPDRTPPPAQRPIF